MIGGAIPIHKGPADHMAAQVELKTWKERCGNYRRGMLRCRARSAWLVAIFYVLGVVTGAAFGWYT